MARGLLSGVIWGTVICIGGAVVLSVWNPLPQAPDVANTQPLAAEPEISSTPLSLPEPSSSESDAQIAQPALPEAPETDTLSALETTNTAPAEAPEVGSATSLAETTDTEQETPVVPAPPEAAPTPTVGSASPTAPEVAEQVTISTEPAQPAPPPAVEQTSNLSDSETPETTEPADLDTTEQAEAEPAPPEPEAIATPTEPEVAVEEPPAEPAPAPRVSSLPRVEPEAPVESTGDAVSAEETPSTTSGPRIGQRVAPLTDRDSAATTLPSVDSSTAPEEPAPSNPPLAQENMPPIEQFAAPFSNPEGKPLMGIVLLDDENSIGAEALENFPYALTFAINPFDPRAEEKMTRYRDAGFEVLALVDLDFEASPEDAEASLEVGLSTLSEAVGLIEGVTTGVQGSRPLSDQVTAILRDKGYGFITQNSGLNTVQKLAAREGVPSAYVFRDFDGANQTPTVMRRFLDQAAFRARQEGGVIMMGRVRPDTISALLLWGLQDRASRVALAPASAVLMGKPQEQ